MNAHKISRKDFLRFRFGLTEESEKPPNLSNLLNNDNVSNVHILTKMELPPEFRSFYREEIEISEFADEQGGIKKIEQELLSALWNNK